MQWHEFVFSKKPAVPVVSSFHILGGVVHSLPVIISLPASFVYWMGL